MIEIKKITRDMTVEREVISAHDCNKAITAIIRRLMRGVSSFTVIHAFVRGDVMEGGEINRRFTDRLLQRLRKEGLIEYRDGYWRLVKGKEA